MAFPSSHVHTAQQSPAFALTRPAEEGIAVFRIQAATQDIGSLGLDKLLEIELVSSTRRDGDGVDKLTHVLYFAGRPVGQWMEEAGQDPTVLFLTTDHLGAPILVTDLSANEVWSGWLEPFGKPVDLRPPPGGGGDDGDTGGDADEDQPTDPPPPDEEDPDDGRDDPPPPDGDPNGRDGTVPDPEPSDPNPHPDGRDEPPPTTDPSDPNPNPDGREDLPPPDPEEPDDGRLVMQVPPAASLGDAGVFLRYPGQWEHAVFRSQATDGMYYNVRRWYAPGTGRYGRPDPLGVIHGDSNPYLYALANSLRFLDPLGLAVLKGFPPNKAREVEQAISDAKDQLEDQPCCTGDPRLTEELLDKLNDPDLVIVFDPGLGFCGQTPFLANVFGQRKFKLGPVAFDPVRCCDLPSTIIHELVHIGSGGSESEAQGVEKRCFNCPRGRASGPKD